jgi:hypothetical protein
MIDKMKNWFKFKEEPEPVEEEPKPEPTWFQNYINSPYK